MMSGYMCHRGRQVEPGSSILAYVSSETIAGTSMFGSTVRTKGDPWLASAALMY